MEAATTQPTAEPSRRVYIDFDPTHDILPDEEIDTYVIHLPGFKKEQLRVQVKSGNLVATGERLLGRNQWSRFRKEFQIPKNCKVNEIRARFDNGLLYITLPKLAPEQGKGVPAKMASLANVDDAMAKKEDSLMKREKSSTRKAREEENKEEKEKEKEKKKKEAKEEYKAKGGTRSDAESLTARIKQKMGEMDFEAYLQPKKLMVGLALATVVSVGWYLHHMMSSTSGSGEQHPNI